MTSHSSPAYGWLFFLGTLTGLAVLFALDPSIHVVDPGDKNPIFSWDKEYARTGPYPVGTKFYRGDVLVAEVGKDFKLEFADGKGFHNVTVDVTCEWEDRCGVIGKDHYKSIPVGRLDMTDKGEISFRPYGDPNNYDGDDAKRRLIACWESAKSKAAELELKSQIEAAENEMTRAEERLAELRRIQQFKDKPDR